MSGKFNTDTLHNLFLIHPAMGVAGGNCKQKLCLYGPDDLLSCTCDVNRDKRLPNWPDARFSLRIGAEGSRFAANELTTQIICMIGGLHLS